jgi:hypothetical protein
VEADQKRSRVERCRELLQILEQEQQYQFKNILTGGGGWFFSNSFIIRALAANPDDVPEIPKQKFNPKIALFRFFGTTQGSNVCCMFRRA